MALVLVGATLMAILAFYFKDNLAPAVQCADGMRNPVNIDNFTTKYWANSAKFEANIAEGKAVWKTGPDATSSRIRCLAAGEQIQESCSGWV